MSKKICVTSTRSVGCTFIDWSIHFLSGQKYYFNVELNQLIPLSKNPITKLNAHNHLKNHPKGSKNLIRHLIKFKSINDTEVLSCYPCMLTPTAAAECLGYKNVDLSDRTILQNVIEYQHNDYNKLFDICKDHSTKLVFISTDIKSPLYHQHQRAFDKYINNNTLLQNHDNLIDQYHYEFQNIFFSKSIKKWKELNLNNVWDIRERMALDLRPFDLLSKENFNFNQPHMWINSQQLWTNPFKVIKQILDYVELELLTDQIKFWSVVANQWQQIQLNSLEFDNNCQHIVDAIVNNWDYPIDLTFMQEVIIQHCLIYQYNLNLKTWNLIKFPNNTKLLHYLLEPNIHEL